MDSRDLRQYLLVRHLERSDIPQRVEVLYDHRVRRNSASHLSLTAADRLARRLERDVDSATPECPQFVIAKQNGETVGFTRLPDIDWLNRTCELSVIMLPRFRVGFGFLAVMRMLDYAYGCLNLQVVKNQVLDCNEMMASADWTAKRAHVRSPYANFTDGRYRAVFAWSQTRSEYERAIAERQRGVAG